MTSSVAPIVVEVDVVGQAVVPQVSCRKRECSSSWRTAGAETGATDRRSSAASTSSLPTGLDANRRLRSPGARLVRRRQGHDRPDGRVLGIGGVVIVLEEDVDDDSALRVGDQVDLAAGLLALGPLQLLGEAEAGSLQVAVRLVGAVRTTVGAYEKYVTSSRW